MCSTVEFWIWQQLSEKAASDMSPMLLIFRNRKTQAAATRPPQLAASTGPFPHGETVSKGWILNPAIDWGPSKGSQELSTHSPIRHPFRNMKPPAVTVWSACQAEMWATGASALCWCWLEEPKERQQSAVGFKRPSVIEGARENPLAGTGGGGQVSDKQRYKTQREANSRVALRVFKKPYPVFIKRIVLPLSRLLWFPTMADKCLFTSWKEPADWGEDYCSAVITYNLVALSQPFVQSCNFTK